jgi:diguanylate cyclase (GGDEF)-like protein/PAS domain S-box-containing protein
MSRQASSESPGNGSAADGTPATDHAALERENERLRHLLRNASDGVHILDRGGNVLEASDSFCSQLGYTRAEALRLNVADWDSHWSAAQLGGVLDGLFGAGARSVFETTHRAKDGSVLPVEVSSFPMELAGRPVLYCASRIIADRKAAEAALRVSEERFRRLFESSPDAVWILREHRFLESNEAAVAMFGLPAREAFRHLHPSQLSPEFQPDGERSDRKAERMMDLADVRGLNRFEWRHRRADGAEFDAEVTLSSIELDGRHAIHAVVRDITDRKRSERALAESEQRYRRVFETSLDVININERASDRYVEVNPAFVELSGYRPGEVLGRSPVELGLWADPQDRVELVRKFLRDGQLRNEEARFRNRSGEVRWGLISSTPMTLDGRELVLSVTRDVTERKHVEQAIAAEREFNTLIIDSTPVYYVALDPALRVLRMNRSLLQALGWAAEEVVGRPYLESFVPAADRAKVAGVFEQIIRAQRQTLNENRIRARSGAELTCEWHGIPIVRDGSLRFIVGMGIDISERLLAEQTVRTLAYYDPLTRLPNRRLLMDRLGHSLAASRRSGEFGALLMLDLDHFKKLNDTRGHDAGDRLLVEVARRLATAVRSQDTVSRLGGDEFVVILDGLDREVDAAARQADAVAEKLRHVVQQLGDAHGDSAGYYSTTSIGVTLFCGEVAPPDVLLKQADVALYQAKDAGRNVTRFFNPQMQAAIDSRSELEAALRAAVVRGEFDLHYQPQVDAAGRVLGVEALLRWRRPGHGLVGPATFIGLAEETGLILAIGRQVLDAACALLRRWSADPATAGLRVAVNVSPRQLRQPDFVAQVQEALRAAGADPARLTLEITEGAVFDDIDSVIEKMRQLNAMGVSFALDDFGTGYSSLSHLKRLSLKELKIDRLFISDIDSSAAAAAIVRAILAMSQALGMRTVAEGVETESQRRFLSDNGCAEFQGYLFARPMPIGELEPLLGAPLASGRA